MSADFEELTDPEDAAENALGLPLLEIYSPIREVWSGEIIAVAEFYEINQQLKSDLASATRASWITVAAAGALLGSVLYFVVLGGSRTIEQQRRALAAQLTQLRDLSAHNRDLRVRVQNAAGRAAANTEQAMRRIGADLHDGPAQYLAFAALRLDTLRDSIARDRISELDVIRGSLDSALSEVRAISRGLALPEMIDRPLCEIVQSVCEAHSLRTDVAIDISCTCTPEPEIGPAVRICVFRFVQEGLNNAWRHAGGKGVAVSLTCEDGLITVSVSDTGPGFPKMSADVPQTRIGLDALRDRVESLGGKFKRLSRPGAGAEIRMDT